MPSLSCAGRSDAGADPDRHGVEGYFVSVTEEVFGGSFLPVVLTV